MDAINQKKKNTEDLGFFKDRQQHAFTALEKAHFISFAPYAFQASLLLRDYNILANLQDEMEGLSFSSLKKLAPISEYGLRILLEAGIGIGLLFENDEKYFITKTGTMFITDPMVVINTTFMRDICYQAAGKLKESIESGKPEGLAYLGDWKTLYEGLTLLTPTQTKSWYDFDHYYSDQVFPLIIPYVFSFQPKTILDIGANTGKFSIKCLKHDQNVKLSLLDLERQLQFAKKLLDENEFQGRYELFAHNMLENEIDIPGKYDIIWMSQFLDCFSDAEIIDLLKKCKKALNPNGKILINELFWDKQPHHASMYSLQMTSLYFATIANGNSQMYDSRVFMKLIEKAGLKVLEEQHGIGSTHSLLTLS